MALFTALPSALITWTFRTLLFECHILGAKHEGGLARMYLLFQVLVISAVLGTPYRT
jgi:hypothetical protein